MTRELLLEACFSQVRPVCWAEDCNKSARDCGQEITNRQGSRETEDFPFLVFLNFFSQIFQSRY